ncbi:protein GOS9-like [Zingiber officinale]|nr:protein GOS9-like [Zingiber officinale]
MGLWGTFNLGRPGVYKRRKCLSLLNAVIDLSDSLLQSFLSSNVSYMAGSSIIPPIKIKIGPWGGLGAGGFDVGQYVSHITKVKLYTGDVVDSLEISYVDDRNQFETYRTGGGGGGLHEFELESGEYINWVVASYKDYYGEICVTELGFKTNLGKEHGPFGDGGGETVSIPVVAGRLVGFFGQYDRYINSIGLYLAPY